MENIALVKSVIQTLSYFDVFNYPLTREELFHFLWQPSGIPKYADFIFTLENILQTDMFGKVDTLAGYYFLSGRQELVAIRERKISYLEEKMKIVVRGTKKLRYIPFFQALFVCNQLPVGVKKNSDIDVFIIVKNNHLWFTRALITFVLSFFLLRRTNKSIADMICLSFYVTDNNLDLSQICISEPDIYQVYWTDQLIPVYDPDDFFSRIQQKNNWVKGFVPDAFQKYSLGLPWKVQPSWFSKKIKNFSEFCLHYSIGCTLEKYIRFLQLQKMKWRGSAHSFSGEKNVVISDQMLKFHENDRKKYFKNEWEKRWKQFLS